MAANLSGEVGGQSQAPAMDNLLVAGGSDIARWVMAIGATWVTLTLGVDIGATRDLAVAFAFLFAGSVIIIHGPDALRNLGFLGS